MNKEKLKTWVVGGMLFSAFCAIVFFSYNLLFTPPISINGVIVEKMYVPNQNVSGPSITTYNRYKSYNYVVSGQKHAQWIAFVKMQDGKVLKVHCTSDHYDKKNVGDKLHFKEYTGGLLEIDYFAHNEEDE